MDATLRRTAGGRAFHLLDAGLVVWIAVWIALGVAIGREVRELKQLSDTVVVAGQAVQQTGRALQALEELPFVGDRIARIREQIETAGTSAVTSGEESKTSIDNLSTLLAVSIAIIPTVPIAALYAPARISRFREVRAIRRAVARARTDPALDEFLARRAAENLPWHRLREVSENPWRDLDERRFGPLADAELRRLGLRRLAGLRG